MPKLITKNKRAYFDYEHKDVFHAGIVLKGYEVKSIRAGEINIKEAFVTIKDGEVWLTNSHIKLYSHAGSIKDYEPTRPRKLLLNKKEIEKLVSAKQAGLTIVPLKVELNGPLIKIVIATARGKKMKDKRSTIQKRETNIDIERELKYRDK